MAQPNSFDKLVGYFKTVSRNAFTYKGKIYQPPRHLAISHLLFRDYVCLRNCGWCCPRFSLDYFKCNVDKLKQRYPRKSKLLEKVQVKVNEKEYNYWSITQRSREEDRCQFLTETDRRCTIHSENPFSCRLEPVKIYVVKDTGWITKKCFARGWVVRQGTKALCRFGEFSEERLKEDIGLISELGVIAREFGLETYCPEIVDFLVNCLRTKQIPKRKELIK